MNIGFSTNAFTNKTIFSAINTISETGYDGIELVVDTPHAFLPLKNADIATLVRYAFGHNNTVDIEKYTVDSSEDASELRKRFIFEARRKLFFLIEF